MVDMSTSWQRRLAVQLAAQLPEEKNDAMAVIEHLKRIASGFLFAEGESNPQGTMVNHRPVFEVLEGSGSSSLRASANGKPSGLPK